MELDLNVCHDQILVQLENGPFRVKTLENPCAIQSVMKLCRNVGVGDILDKLEIGSCWIKKWFTRSDL